MPTKKHTVKHASAKKRTVTKRLARAHHNQTHTSALHLFSGFDLGIAVGIVLIALAFSVIIASIAQSAAENGLTAPRLIPHTIESVKDTTTDATDAYRFRALPRLSETPVHTIAENTKNTIQVTVTDPDFRSRYAYVIQRYTKQESPQGDAVPSTRTARKLAQQAAWLPISATEPASFEWQAPAYAQEPTQLSNVVDIFVFSGRNYTTLEKGQLQTGLYLKDFAVMRYVVQPTSPSGETQPLETPATQAEIKISLSPQSPASNVVEVSKPSSRVARFTLTPNNFERILLKGITVTFESKNRESNSATGNMMKNALSNVTLTSSGHLLGSAPPTLLNSTTLKANIALQDASIDPGQPYTFDVDVDTKSFTQAGSLLSGLVFETVLQDIPDAETSAQHTKLTQEQFTFSPAPAVRAAPMTVAGGIMTASWKGDTPAGLKEGGEKQIIGKFEIKFDSFTERSAILSDIVLSLSSTMATPFSRTLRLYKDSVADNNIMASHTFQKGEPLTLSTTMDMADQTIAHNATKNFIVTLDTQGATPGDRLELELNTDNITWSDFGTAVIRTVEGLPLVKQIITY
ncbi:MAG: hypothetical protein UX39_C0002G0030 [Candidatus Magasanikbacteria bacterium GW2011_GWA2_46_17]|uniref:Uncharacterized protein n=1 Tax=Candidatus Magasanikbacteria bacterium GW2011_GWA2_46_17 TaxID=1619042 RepID=A0A0G1P3E2_9BACT|nr:MAG: hypothetical protein UX39_C0002G0030 [Candidatus Magasanikbacteria bacterium GW2011_GWA2_46_17]